MGLYGLSNQQMKQEFRLAVRSYAETGHLPQDHFWERLQDRRELNPVRFDHHHPRIAGFFTPPAHLCQLPAGRFWDNLRHRAELNPARFERHHPFLGPFVIDDVECRNMPFPAPSPNPVVPQVESQTLSNPTPPSNPGPPPTVTPGVPGTPPPPLVVPEPPSVLSALSLVALLFAAWGARRLRAPRLALA